VLTYQTDRSEGSFEGISSLVRGRVTLSDLNELWQLLSAAFKSGDTSLTWEELSKKGAKVSGKTGEARVNCLRALKLIQISKQGISEA
jgi:hypothetical protein